MQALQKIILMTSTGSPRLIALTSLLESRNMPGLIDALRVSKLELKISSHRTMSVKKLALI